MAERDEPGRLSHQLGRASRARRRRGHGFSNREELLGAHWRGQLAAAMTPSGAGDGGRLMGERFGGDAGESGKGAADSGDTDVGDVGVGWWPGDCGRWAAGLLSGQGWVDRCVRHCRS